jgi:hypothetical protein
MSMASGLRSLSLRARCSSNSFQVRRAFTIIVVLSHFVTFSCARRHTVWVHSAISCLGIGDAAGLRTPLL